MKGVGRDVLGFRVSGEVVCCCSRRGIPRCRFAWVAWQLLPIPTPSRSCMASSDIVWVVQRLLSPDVSLSCPRRRFVPMYHTQELIDQGKFGLHSGDRVKVGGQQGIWSSAAQHTDSAFATLFQPVHVYPRLQFRRPGQQYTGSQCMDAAGHTPMSWSHGCFDGSCILALSACDQVRGSRRHTESSANAVGGVLPLNSSWHGVHAVLCPACITGCNVMQLNLITSPAAPPWVAAENEGMRQLQGSWSPYRTAFGSAAWKPTCR